MVNDFPLKVVFWCETDVFYTFIGFELYASDYTFDR